MQFFANFCRSTTNPFLQRTSSATPSSSSQHGQQPPPQNDPVVTASHLRQSQVDAVEKLVNACHSPPSPHVLSERRVFFERLVQLLSGSAETLTAPPQVSKSVVDLYRLYYAVRKRGGFEQVLHFRLLFYNFLRNSTIISSEYLTSRCYKLKRIYCCRMNKH